jgi:serine/threonine-protein kinase
VSHPDRLGKYEITGVLGEGAMGVVYMGFDPDIRRPVALKTIRRQLTDGSDFAATVAARFRNEAQAAGRLAHPGIVGVYEFGEDGPVAYIAMEYVEGRSIANVLASQVRFPDEDIPGLMTQLLEALEHAHAQGVWHRDIKPANVILSRGGRLKLADFGIARIDAGGLTQTHMMVGTPSYMAPEQFTGATIDARVDIYSAGVVLYVLLTGKPPFVGSTESLMYRVVHEPPPLPSQAEGPPRPAFYDALVERALAKDPAARFPSALAFRDALVAAVGQPIDTRSWEKTVVLTAPRAPAPGTERTGGGGSSIGSAVRHWDRAELHQAQATLAEFLGPLATVLVRRAARECDTLPELYARLAEQVTDPGARQAFLGRLAATGQATTGAGASGGGKPVAATRPGLALDDALRDSAQRLLALRVGPIARIVVKKAAATAADRAAFLALVADAVPDPAARAALLAELERLP